MMESLQQKQKQFEKFAFVNATSIFDFSERYFKDVILRDLKEPKQMRRYLEKEIYPAFGSMSIFLWMNSPPWI
jgi:hypothetical protein